MLRSASSGTQCIVYSECGQSLPILSGQRFTSIPEISARTEPCVIQQANIYPECAFFRIAAGQECLREEPSLF